MAKRKQDTEEHRPSLVEAALKGAAAGMLGGAVMTMAMKVEQKALLPVGAKTEPPPKKLVETEAEEHGIEPSQAQAKAAGVDRGRARGGARGGTPPSAPPW